MLVLAHELLVRERLLRVLVQELHVRMRRRGIEIVVELLHVFAVVSLVARDTEEAFLEYAVLAVPQREPEAKTLVIVGDTTQAVLTPPVHARASMFMGEMAPGVTVRRVILAYGSLYARRSGSADA